MTLVAKMRMLTYNIALTNCPFPSRCSSLDEIMKTNYFRLLQQFLKFAKNFKSDSTFHDIERHEPQ